MNELIIWSENAIQARKVERSWAERLFSFPWRPFKKFDVFWEPAIFSVGNRLIVHPNFKEIIKKQMIWIPGNSSVTLKEIERLWDVGV